MSRNASTFAAVLGAPLVALCVVLVGAGAGTASSDEGGPEAPPTTTTQPTTEGNPWHG